MTTDLGMSLADYNRMQARSLSEAQLQAAIIGLAERLGWLVYHTHDSRRSQAGFPDLVLVHAGQKRTLFRELKTMTGKVTDAQQRFLLALTAAGQDAKVWRPDAWVSGDITDELYAQEEHVR